MNGESASERSQTPAAATAPTTPSRGRLARVALLRASLALLAGTPLASAPVAADDRRSPAEALELSTCTIGDGHARLTAECASLEVPLDPVEEDGATLPLAIARLAASRPAPDATPFTLIAGGPGQSAIESWPTVAHAFRHIARERDVILVDQRGTGASGRLDCPGTEAAPELGGLSETDPAEIRRHVRECLARLDADPRLYTTSVAVADLERVRERLGIERWNLYGVSYGTRVAQHYARRHPERVRTMILDAVVPPDVPLGPDIAPFAQRALAAVFARCASEDGCRARFPAIDARTGAWRAALERAPREVRYEDLASGERRTLRFDAARLAAVLRLLSYDARTQALLPSMLDAAIEDDHLAPLARQSELQAATLGESIAGGMHQAVVCTEDAPRIPPDAADAARGTYLGAALLEALEAGCAEWPAGRLDPDFFEPLASAVPTLVLSGGTDPITPPVYGERVAGGLERARHVVNAGQGHMQATLGCVPELMARFVATADPEALDVDCLGRLRPPPFFVDANGPAP